MPRTGGSAPIAASASGGSRGPWWRWNAGPGRSAGWAPIGAAAWTGACWRIGALAVPRSASTLAQTLGGRLVPAVPVPHRADGRFDPAAQDAYAAWMALQDIAGVAVWAHSGRGLHLGEETAAAVLASWRRALPGKLVIAGAGARPRSRPSHPSARLTPPADAQGLTSFVIQATLDMAVLARDLGADAILVYPPTLLADLRDHDGRFVEVHAALEQVGLPVIAFWLYQAAGGCAYSHRVLDRILALPHVAGIKVATLDSRTTFQDIAALVPANKVLITGEDRFLGYSLRLGARSALIGMGAVETRLQAALLTAHVRGEADRFLRLSDACDRLGAVLFREPVDGYPRRLLSLLAAQGIIPLEGAFDPFGPEIPARQLEEVEKVARDLPAP
jgi:4-hydroxy-tetrahydrodipicolinate synthase